MAKELANFAGGGVVVHNQRFDPELSDDVIEFIETHSDFRQSAGSRQHGHHYPHGGCGGC